MATVRQRDTAAAGQQAVQAGHLAAQAEGRTSTDAGGVGGRVVRRWWVGVVMHTKELFTSGAAQQCWKCQSPSAGMNKLSHPTQLASPSQPIR